MIRSYQRPMKSSFPKWQICCLAQLMSRNATIDGKAHKWISIDSYDWKSNKALEIETTMTWVEALCMRANVMPSHTYPHISVVSSRFINKNRMRKEQTHHSHTINVYNFSIALDECQWIVFRCDTHMSESHIFNIKILYFRWCTQWEWAKNIEYQHIINQWHSLECVSDLRVVDSTATTHRHTRPRFLSSHLVLMEISQFFFFGCDGAQPLTHTVHWNYWIFAIVFDAPLFSIRLFRASQCPPTDTEKH